MGKKSPKKPIKSLLPVFLLSAILLALFGTASLVLNVQSVPLKNTGLIQDSTQLVQSDPIVLAKTASIAATFIQHNREASPNFTTAQTYSSQLRVPILMYHYIGNNPNPGDKQRDTLSISPEKFDSQMRYLSDNGYRTTSLDTLYAALQKLVTLPDRSVVLTFDDGYVDFYYNAFPILKKYGFSATVFIPTGMVGQKAYLTWEQIRELHLSGLINFGAHSVNHSYLPALSKEVALSELSKSKKELQEKLGIPINFMAYPYGSTTEEITELVKQSGYIGAVGTWASKIQSQSTIYTMPRLRVSGEINLKTFAELF